MKTEAKSIAAAMAARAMALGMMVVAAEAKVTVMAAVFAGNKGGGGSVGNTATKTTKTTTGQQHNKNIATTRKINIIPVAID